jgi:hypothetical protein
LEGVQECVGGLHQEMKRVNGMLLEYIMCNNSEPGQAEIIHTTEHESLNVTTPLVGEAFEADNGKDW